MKKLLALLVAFGLIGFTAGCSGETTSAPKKDTPAEGEGSGKPAEGEGGEGEGGEGEKPAEGEGE